VALIIALFLVGQTNIRPAQADVIFKQAKPYDDQATRTTQADTAARRNAWDIAIAIYEAAINRSPKEDFYYLFLGRAYLEQSSITEDPAKQAQLLTQAETLLLRAQSINPLNTDHTANLARLNTRWFAATDDPTERTERLNLAARYYETALVLSPQNSVIRNEYARLMLDAAGDCDAALTIYDESATIDPYYAQTHLARANALVVCGDRSEGARDEYYRRAIDSVETALAIAPGNVRAWIQLAQLKWQLGEFEEAFAAAESAMEHNNPPVVSPAEIDFLAARIAVGLGNTSEARQLAERALLAADETMTGQINALLETLGRE